MKSFIQQYTRQVDFLMKEITLEKMQLAMEKILKNLKSF